jgi:YHS domain-containing protein
MKFIFLLIIIYLVYQISKGFIPKGKDHHKRKDADVIDEMVQDPVCKVYVPKRESFRRNFGGKEILFCSKECADKFDFGKRG